MFDLDNTLYPHHVNLWQQVDARIGEYIGSSSTSSPSRRRRIQKDYYKRYGTSMRGMMTEHGIELTNISLTCIRSTIRRSSPIRRWARRSKGFPAAS